MLLTGLLVAAPGQPGMSNGTAGGYQQPGAANGNPGGYQHRATPAQGTFAQPGTINYVEGQVKVNGQPITGNNIGSVVLTPGQLLQTGNGKVEMLLTPGVFVRLAPNSTVKMVSASLSNTQVELTEGQAMMEVALYEKENHIQMAVGGSVTTIKDHGVYEFTANPASVRVFDGKAVVGMDDHSRTISKGDEVALDAANPKLKTHDFNPKQAQATDDLYAWSKLRADYMAQANMSAAERYAYEGPGLGYGPWYGAGWYWNPYVNQYAFLLGNGFLWDPFGYGFFSPGYWGAYAPYLGYGRFGYGYGFGRGVYGFRGVPGAAITRGSVAGGMLERSAVGGAGGGFRGVTPGGAGGFRGSVGGFGGFHGGGGGRR